jgi:chemotaxis protein CheD
MLISNLSELNRDPSGGGRRLSLGQGEYGVSDEPDLVLTTVLGSCVAACIHDPVARVGGMNHFVLPQRRLGSSGDPARYGDDLMPRLIEGLLQAGARQSRLEAQLFGGASPGRFVNSIGEDNLAFAYDFLDRLGVRVAPPQQSGPAGCRIDFRPADGHVKHVPLARLEKAQARRIILPRVKPLNLTPVAA